MSMQSACVTQLLAPTATMTEAETMRPAWVAGWPSTVCLRDSTRGILDWIRWVSASFFNAATCGMD